MNTQQFFKGLLMALVAIAVTFFSQNPIDYLLMAVTAVCTIITYAGKNLIPWFSSLHSDSPAGSLSKVNLISAFLIFFGSGVLDYAGSFLIGDAIDWRIVLKVSVYVTLTYLTSTFFAPPYNAKKTRLFASKKYIRSFKGLIIILCLLAPAVVSAQGPAKGFFRLSNANPLIVNMIQNNVKQRDLLSKGLLSQDEVSFVKNVWIIRPTIGFTAKAFSYNPELKELESSTFSKIALGVGYQRYEELNGESYNSLGVNALLMFDSDFDMSKLNLTGALTVHTLKFIDFGIGRDFGLKRWLALTNISYSF